jgi:hypothetical protein
MTKKNKNVPVQEGLFGTSFTCPDMANLPLILDPQGEIEVLAPGSVYQPLLLSPDKRNLNIQLGPGALDGNEEKFVRDLIRFLHPAGDHPKSEKTPLQWQSKNVWLKRNVEKQPGSFRLRVDDSDWFYPDFIVWILDRETKTQTFGFVDPKGFSQGLREGWENYKIVSTLYLPHVIEHKLAGQTVTAEGEEWIFRVRGAFISTTPLASLRQEKKFAVYSGNGEALPDEADFNRARIVFPGHQSGYIETLLNILTEDNSLDELFKSAARLRYGPQSFEPNSEAEYDLALRSPGGSEAQLVESIIKDYLKPDAAENFGARAQNQWRLKLMEYARTGFLGIGEEKVPYFRDHPTPCEELWKRISANKESSSI